MVKVVASTLALKVTPDVLSVIVTAPAALDPISPSVTKPPASRIVRPPLASTKEPNPIVAPAVAPESKVNALVALVTAPTFNIPDAWFPVSSTVVPASVTAPKSICVLVVLIVPDKVTVLGKSAPPFPSVDNPPAKVRVSPPLPKVSVPSFKKFVSPAASKVDELITTLYASLPALLTVNPVVMSTS